MAGADELLAAIEAIYAAGLAAELWPRALAAVMNVVGRIAATLEVFDRQPLQLLEFHSLGLPPANELKYLDLLPHVRQAFDMSRRLRGTAETRHSLERALDWLADGVMLVRTDGTVVYANEAFQAITRRNDGVRTR